MDQRDSFEFTQQHTVHQTLQNHNTQQICFKFKKDV